MFYFPHVSSLAAGGVGVCVYSACEPALYKLIHSLASIQCSGAACWLMIWRKPVILNWESVLSTHQHSPRTQRYRNSEKFHLRTWIHFGGLLQTQTRSASSHLSCLDGFIQQKQQNTYTQEIGEGGKGQLGMGSSCPTVGKILAQEVFSRERCVWQH